MVQRLGHVELVTEPTPLRMSFVVSIFDTVAKMWRTVLTTTDKAADEVARSFSGSCSNEQHMPKT